MSNSNLYWPRVGKATLSTTHIGDLIASYLLIRGQGSEERDEVRLEVLCLNNTCKLAQFGGSSPTHHGGVISTQIAEMPAIIQQLP